MKNTGTCPKCASNDIRASRSRTWSMLLPVGFTIFNAVYTSWFVCASCGFVETWIERERDLATVRKKLPAR